MGERPVTIGLVEAALFLHVHKNTLRERACAGLIPGAKIGRSWVFIEEDLLAYMREQYTPKVVIPCRSTNVKAVRSGGRTSATLGNGYAAQLDTLIAQRRRPSTTNSK